jgi:hypothetical protein
VDEMSPERVSRRKMLKRIGAGAAVAWTAPILSSIRTPAFAQYPGCNDNLICGVKLVVCGSDASGTCNCVRSVEGLFLCGNDGCGPACTTSAECQTYAAGSVCQAPDTGCCGQVCIAPCGAFGAVAEGTGSNSRR